MSTPLVTTVIYITYVHFQWLMQVRLGPGYAVTGVVYQEVKPRRGQRPLEPGWSSTPAAGRRLRCRARQETQRFPNCYVRSVYAA